MTDLEDLWESYPTSEPPIPELLREGRRQARARRRHRVLRPLLAGVTAAALAGAFLVGTRAGTDADDDATLAAPDLRTSAFRADLHPATSCADLLSSYRARGRAAVTAYGWGFVSSAPLSARSFTIPARGNQSMGYLGDLSLNTQDSSRTGTNVQEVDVDEPDQVKTDGSRVVRVDRRTLSVYDTSGDTIRLTAQLTLPRMLNGEILLAGDTVVAIGADTRAPASGRSSVPPGSRVQTVSLADPSEPTIVSDVAYSAAITSVRQHGSVVRLVLTAAAPTLDFVYPHGKVTRSEALAHNRELVRSTTLSDWMPTYDDGDGPLPLLDCDDVATPPAGLALGTVSVVGFDAEAPNDRATIGVAGQTSIAYESADHLYLVDSPGWGGWGSCWCVPAAARTEGAAWRSTIFQLDLDGTRAIHVATGHVDGTIADRWSVDEADDVLRVAVTRDEALAAMPGTVARDRTRRVLPRSSSVVTMRADGDRLVESGRLDGLGVDETLTAARWTDDLAILSTARATDPLYTVDLSDPDRPRLLGALKIPGFTSYLHPIGDGLLLAVGEAGAFTGGGRAGAQVGLFDISDLTDVQQVDVSSLRRRTWPVAGADPRAFTWLRDRDTALTTFTTNRGTMVLGVYRVTGTTLTGELRNLPVTDPSRVRTFELADGRVVLMAGSTLEFLDL
ncbi:hypothetical protein GCM10023350_32810 [Nocardioides endophyticus]|uniref:Beta propeller domain-containing protein n=1 Tax=Nocardioides endophyticus TaxID=1353775 RepID=A0ABP8Z3I4_9ACTN